MKLRKESNEQRKAGFLGEMAVNRDRRLIASLKKKKIEISSDDRKRRTMFEITEQQSKYQLVLRKKVKKREMKCSASGYAVTPTALRGGYDLARAML